MIRLWLWWMVAEHWLREKLGRPKRRKSPQDRQVEALMTILDPETNIGITARATPEAIEFLKGSDSPFAGYVISCLVEDDRVEAEYEDWVQRTLERTSYET